MKRNVFALPENVNSVLERLETAGFPCYVVGGAVRDMLEGRVPHDYDLCTAALPEQTKALFAEKHVIETGLKHGTITVLADGEPLEITTFRTESTYTDGRRPDAVQFVTDIKQDLARRDFTVNAMAWNPARGLCDPFGGQTDLQKGILRCVGNADMRFTEDALRILRALRFASQRGYAMEAETANAVHRNKQQLAHISAERITDELLNILCGAYVGEVLLTYSDIMIQILPELKPMCGFAQHNPYHKYEVWEHSVRAVESIRPDPLLRLTMLFHDVGKPSTYTQDENGIGHFYGHPAVSMELAEQAAARLRLSAQMEQQFLFLVRHHDTPLGSTTRQVRRKLAGLGEEVFRQLLAIKKADGIGQGTTPQNLTELLDIEQLLAEVLAENACLTRRDLAIKGQDLIDWGFQGREIGYYLSAMLSHVLDDPSCNTREKLGVILTELVQEIDSKELTVSGMSAKCCVKQVKKLLGQFSSIQKIEIDLNSGHIWLTGAHIPIGQVQECLTEAGYEVVL